MRWLNCKFSFSILLFCLLLLVYCSILCWDWKHKWLAFTCLYLFILHHQCQLLCWRMLIFQVWILSELWWSKKIYEFIKFSQNDIKTHLWQISYPKSIFNIFHTQYSPRLVWQYSTESWEWIVFVLFWHWIDMCCWRIWIIWKVLKRNIIKCMIVLITIQHSQQFSTILNNFSTKFQQ